MWILMALCLCQAGGGVWWRCCCGPNTIMCPVWISSLRNTTLLSKSRELQSLSLFHVISWSLSVACTITRVCVCLWDSVVFVKHIDQMLQRHLLFRNTLEVRLTTDGRSCAAGDAFLNLTGQNNVMPFTIKIITCNPLLNESKVTLKTFTLLQKIIILYLNFLFIKKS